MLSVLLLFAPASYGQQEQVAIPWTGAAGITLTVDQIMAQQDPEKIVHYKALREHETNLHKLKNPNAPEIAFYPPNDPGNHRNNSPGINTINTATQAIGSSFLASALNVSGFIPPDCNGAAGPTQLLTVANGRIRVYSKAGVLGALNVTNDVFFNSVRNGSSISDSHIRYDRLTQRWFVVAINVASTNNRVVIAVSSGPTITNTSSFTFFFFQFNLAPPAGDAGKFLDYPTFGVDANALYIGGVRFNPNLFDGCPVFVVRKSSVLGAGPIVLSAFRSAGGAASGIYVPQGVDNDDPTASAGYFIGTDAGAWSKINIIRVNTPGGTPTLTNLTPITVPANNQPLLQVHLGAAANRRLDGLDDRLFAAHLMKNKITGVTTLWTSHNTEVNSSGVASGTMDRNASRWYEFGNLSTTPVLIQAGTLFDNAASSPRGFWNSSIAMSGQGHSLLGSSTAGLTHYADVIIAGRYSGDVAGQLQPFVLATASTTAYNVQATDGQRWGDYSQTVVDPNDNMTMWTFQEYCDAANSWGLRVLQLIAPAPPPTASLVALPVVGIVPAVGITVIASSTPNNTGFFDPGPDAGGPGFANHITASVTGGITVNNITFIDPTHLTLSLNTSLALPGTYPITITNPDGQTTIIYITVVAGSPLPVELISFTAAVTTHGCLLEWTTASEINNDYFTIQRSTDGIDFEDIGKINGNGNTTIIHQYSFTDPNPYAGVSYYRLKQTDYDGSITYSPIVYVRFILQNFQLAGVTSDHVSHSLKIIFNDNYVENIEYRLMDLYGRVIASGCQKSGIGLNSLILQEDFLAQSIYYLTISNGTDMLSRKICY